MKQKKLISLIILSCILFTEIALRLFWSQELSIRDRHDDIFEDDSVLLYTYKPNKEFKVGGTTLHINEQGYIGKDIGPKSTDTFRIAVIGACEVAGSVHQPEYNSFVPMLQTHFSCQGDKVELLNCGIDGDNRSFEQFMSVEYKVTDFQPDIILLQYGLPFFTQYARRANYRDYKLTYPLNDPEALKRTSHMVDNLYRYSRWIKLISYSYIIRACLNMYYHRESNTFSYYINLYKNKNISLGDYKGKQYSLEESVEMIQILQSRLREKGILLFLFQFGTNKEVISCAKENQLPLISLDVHFVDEDIFYKDGHWNKNGCQKIADCFYRLITRHRLIPENYIQESKCKNIP